MLWFRNEPVNILLWTGREEKKGTLTKQIPIFSLDFLFLPSYMNGINYSAKLRLQLIIFFDKKYDCCNSYLTYFYFIQQKSLYDANVFIVIEMPVRNCITLAIKQNEKWRDLFKLLQIIAEDILIELLTCQFIFKQSLK